MSHIQRVETGYDVEASKKRIDITVNEDLVRIARTYTDNLSGTIEALLAEWAQAERRKRDEDHEHRRKVVESWNEFDERHGRFADDWNGAFLPDEDAR